MPKLSLQVPGSRLLRRNQPVISSLLGLALPTRIAVWVPIEVASSVTIRCAKRSTSEGVGVMGGVVPPGALGFIGVRSVVGVVNDSTDPNTVPYALTAMAQK